MPTLPAAADFTGASITEAQFKTAITDQRGFLADLLGTAGTVATALTALGAVLNTVSAKTSAYTVVAADRGKLIDATTGTWTLTLTAAATLGAGFAFAVRNSGTGVITIDPSSTEQIDGGTTVALGEGESCLVVCNGTAFKTVGRTVTLPAATASVDGYMTSTYAAKLDGIEAGANLGVSLDVGVGGVGMIAPMYNNGLGVASGATAAGSDLKYTDGDGSAASGTWRNITADTAGSFTIRIFQRIS